MIYDKTPKFADTYLDGEDDEVLPDGREITFGLNPSARSSMRSPKQPRGKSYNLQLVDNVIKMLSHYQDDLDVYTESEFISNFDRDSGERSVESSTTSE